MMDSIAQVLAGVTVAAWAVHQANHHKQTATLLDRLAVAMIGAGAVMAVLGVAFSRAPVVIDGRAKVVSHAPGDLRLQMTGVKPTNRAMCEYLGTEAYVVSDGTLLEVPSVYENDPLAGNTRPPGRHNFGVLRLTYPPELVIDSAWVRARHKCAWWMPETKSDFGPFAVPIVGGIPQPDPAEKPLAP